MADAEGVGGLLKGGRRQRQRPDREQGAENYPSPHRSLRQKTGR
jgi:hypothetical protein